MKVYAWRLRRSEPGVVVGVVVSVVEVTSSVVVDVVVVDGVVVPVPKYKRIIKI